MLKLLLLLLALLTTKDSPPTLLIHGGPDTLAWYKHSERLRRG